MMMWNITYTNIKKSLFFLLPAFETFSVRCCHHLLWHPGYSAGKLSDFVSLSLVWCSHRIFPHALWIQAVSLPEDKRPIQMENTFSKLWFPPSVNYFQFQWDFTWSDAKTWQCSVFTYQAQLSGWLLKITADEFVGCALIRSQK